MLTSTVSDQGQTTVPASVQKALKAPPGTVLAWAVNGSTAEVVPLIKANACKRARIDYEAIIRDWKASLAVPDHLLQIGRSTEP